MTELNSARFRYDELLNTWTSPEVVSGAVGQSNVVEIPGFMRSVQGPHQFNIGELPVYLAVITGVLEGEHQHLVKGDIIRCLATRCEFYAIFVSSLVIWHDKYRCRPR